MSDNLMEKVNAFGERLKIGGAEVGRKMTAGMSSMSFKMKELFQGPNQINKLVEDTTSETLDEPNWALNLELCDMINTGNVNSVELIRGIKKRIMIKNNPRVQYLALVLIETIVKNCEKSFSEVAAEKVLDEMLKLIDDPQTVVNNRNKALVLIEAWGESANELRYLPVYEETYKSLKSRGVRFPGRDNESLVPIFTPARSVTDSEEYSSLDQHIHHDSLTHTFTPEQIQEAFAVARNSIELLSTVLSSSPQQDILKDELSTMLMQQCRQSQQSVQRIIESSSGENSDAVVFEALNVNDEIQKVLSKFEDLKKPPEARLHPVPAMIPVEADESPRLSKQEGTASLIRKPGKVGGRGNDEMLENDLDDMIFGMKLGDESGSKKPKCSSKDDLISL